MKASSLRRTCFDEETSRGIEALYLTDDAVRRRALVIDVLALKPGERVLDMGTGPGFVVLDMADAVGPTGSVVAVDSAPAMVQIATQRLADRDWVTVQSGDASKLDPGCVL